MSSPRMIHGPRAWSAVPPHYLCRARIWCLSLPLLCSHLVLVSTSAVLASGACLQGLRHRLNDWTACASSAAPSLLHPTHRLNDWTARASSSAPSLLPPTHSLNDVSSAILAHAGRVPPSPQKAPESRRRCERDQALPSVSREDLSALGVPAWGQDDDLPLPSSPKKPKVPQEQPAADISSEEESDESDDSSSSD